MMEKTDTCHCHCHTETVATFDNSAVTNRTTRLSNILNTGTSRTFNIILKREESVRAESNICHLLVPSFLFLGSERLRASGKISLPYSVFE